MIVMDEWLTIQLFYCLITFEKLIIELNLILNRLHYAAYVLRF